jgi:hypothetical protein
MTLTMIFQMIFQVFAMCLSDCQLYLTQVSRMQLDKNFP